MADANLNLKAKGVDQTAQMFKSIKNRAKDTGISIKKMLGGSLAAAGAYLGFRNIISGFNELGSMSDIAQKTSTNVGELTSMLTSLAVLGIKTDIDSLAKSFQTMERNTGRSGMAGFYQTLEELGKIPDIQKRNEEAMKVFGKSGLEFMPLINASKDGTTALREVSGAFIEVSQSAADNGDKIADSMTIATNGFKNLWLNALGAVGEWFDGLFAGGVRQATAELMADIEYNAKLMVITFQRAFKQIGGGLVALGESIGGAIGAAIGTLWEGGSWEDYKNNVGNAISKPWENLETDLAEFDAEAQARANNWAKRHEERLQAIKNLESNISASVAVSGHVNNPVAEVAKKLDKVSNALVEANTNEVQKMAILGPQLNSETKKQTQILEKIAKNTEQKTESGTAADNIIPLHINK